MGKSPRNANGSFKLKSTCSSIPVQRKEVYILHWKLLNSLYEGTQRSLETLSTDWASKESKETNTSVICHLADNLADCARILLQLLPHSCSTVYKSDSQMLCTFYHIVVDTPFSWTILFFPWCKLLTVKQTLHHICRSFLEMVSFLCGQSNFYIM